VRGGRREQEIPELSVFVSRVVTHTTKHPYIPPHIRYIRELQIGNLKHCLKHAQYIAHQVQWFGKMGGNADVRRVCIDWLKWCRFSID